MRIYRLAANRHHRAQIGLFFGFQIVFKLNEPLEVLLMLPFRYLRQCHPSAWSPQRGTFLKKSPALTSKHAMGWNPSVARERNAKQVYERQELKLKAEILERGSISSAFKTSRLTFKLSMWSLPLPLTQNNAGLFAWGVNTEHVW